MKNKKPLVKYKNKAWRVYVPYKGEMREVTIDGFKTAKKALGCLHLLREKDVHKFLEARI